MVEAERDIASQSNEYYADLKCQYCNGNKGHLSYRNIDSFPVIMLMFGSPNENPCYTNEEKVG